MKMKNIDRLGNALKRAAERGKALKRDTGYALTCKRVVRVYVAGPISKGNQEENVERAIGVYNRLVDAGYMVYLPHFNWYADRLRNRTWSEWMEIDKEWLGLCDVVWRMRGESKGADVEVKTAKVSGKPVVRNMAELRRTHI